MEKTLLKDLNEQINHEMHSAYLYLAISEFFESESLPGFAKFFKHHAEEEMQHAMKIYSFLVERGQRVTFDAISAPKITWKNAKEACNSAYEHEKLVTSLINKCYKQARASEDFATEEFLNWFVKEQVEEEAVTKLLVDRVELAKEPGHLLFIDGNLNK